MVNQVYKVQITPEEYVMLKNPAIFRCIIPSFVADFVYVVGWINEDETEYHIENNFTGGTYKLSPNVIYRNFPSLF